MVSLVFSHLGFWSGNLFLIMPFPDLCLLVLFCHIITFCVIFSSFCHIIFLCSIQQFLSHYVFSVILSSFCHIIIFVSYSAVFVILFLCHIQQFLSFYHLFCHIQQFLAHLSRRLTGELIVYPCSGVRPSSSVVRPSSVVRRPQFQRSSPLKPLGQSKPNFMWSILRKGERMFI